MGHSLFVVVGVFAGGGGGIDGVFVEFEVIFLMKSEELNHSKNFKRKIEKGKMFSTKTLKIEPSFLSLKM
ncbi:hypothetical protein WICPIJ_001251 [Wickerhamomyces pijperi]|uniref:Uncharacterized protein n=1 Tax=Wickerhamomyces pijperi TaxID=599730 RepID=A0A9P8QB39_WICPI|nr:hypothetical protein WICPIJ_001251 [Wickerhamomyces pijperi]